MSHMSVVLRARCEHKTAATVAERLFFAQGKVIWSDEVQFKMSGIVNCHDCVYWAPINPHIHVGKEVNLLVVMCGVDCHRMV